MVKRRIGFTLVELLVVIAIIGVLVALLLPAVQAAREAARRMQCSNNLKQIALATHNYHDTYLAMPPGSWHALYGTWMASLLPYVEQGNLAAAYRNDNMNAHNATSIRYGHALNIPVTSRSLSAFTCPSDVRTPSNPSFLGGVSFHNYVANHGNTTHYRRSPAGFMSNGTTPNVYGGAPFICVLFQGVASPANHLHDNTFKTHVRLAEITDGTSNTLAFSETIQGKGGDLRGFAWWGGGHHFETKLTPNTSLPDITSQNCTPAVKANPPCKNHVNTNHDTAESIAARSRHPNGVMAALCDGSVRFFSNNIALDPWRAWGTAHGGDQVGGD